MNDLRRHGEDYLSLRRALGYKLVGEGRLFAGFVTFCEQTGVSRLSTEVAVAWTTAVPGSSAYLARRMRVARGFAGYVHSLNPSTEVPPAELFPAGKHRPVPDIYAKEDVLSLMTAARTLKPALESSHLRDPDRATRGHRHARQ